MTVFLEKVNENYVAHAANTYFNTANSGTFDNLPRILQDAINVLNVCGSCEGLGAVTYGAFSGFSLYRIDNLEAVQTEENIWQLRLKEK